MSLFYRETLSPHYCMTRERESLCKEFTTCHKTGPSSQQEGGFTFLPSRHLGSSAQDWEIMTVPLWWFNQGICLDVATYHNNYHGMSWLWIIVAVPLWLFTLVGFLQAAGHPKNGPETR